MKLIIVRHGHTNDLKHRIIQGHRPVPLNTLGRRQAQRAARALRRIRLSRIISSDSPRAVQTATAIRRHHPRIRLETSDLLREKSGGVYEGRRFSTLSPYVLNRILHPHWRPRRGESHADLFRRARRWYRLFQGGQPRGTIVLVSHGGFIQSLLAIILHGPRMKFRHEFHHDNTGMTIIHWHRGRPVLKTLNATGHLEPHWHSPRHNHRRPQT